MASGSFSNGSGQNCCLWIEWTSSPGTGGSQVYAKLVAQNQNLAYFSAVVYGYGITINGSESTGSGASLSGSMNGSSMLKDHSVWVPYTGNKTIGLSGYANFNGIWSLSNQTISGTATLDKVGSAPTMSTMTAPKAMIVSETTTTIDVAWDSATSYNNSGGYYVDVNINDGGWNLAKDVEWGTTHYAYTIESPKAGDKYEFRVCAYNDVGQSAHYYSGVVTLNSLTAPTIGTIDEYNPYVTSSITVPLSGGSQALGLDVCRRCALYYNGTMLLEGATYASTGVNNTSQELTYSSSNYINQLGSTKYKDTFEIVAWSENENGTKSPTVSKSFTVNINTDGGATPTVATPTLSGGCLGYPSTCFISNLSKVTVTSGSVSLRRAPSGSTLSYSISVTGTNEVSGSSYTYNYLANGKKTARVTVTDSRGLSSYAETYFMVQQHYKPTITTFTQERDGNDQTKINVTHGFSYTPIYSYETSADVQGTQLNTISTSQYAIYYKDYTGTLTWNNLNSASPTVVTQVNSGVNEKVSTEKVYWLQCRIADKVYPDSYITTTILIPSIKTTLGLRKWGVGINCVPQEKWAFEISGASYFKDEVTIEDTIKAKHFDYDGSGGTSYAKGRDTALLRIKNSYTKFTPITSVKTVNGSWEIGTYGVVGYSDTLIFSYINDSVYNSGYMYTDQFKLRPSSETTDNDTILTLGKAFPVGAVYITYTATSPQSFLGGTWVQFGQGRTLVGVGTGTDSSSTSKTFTAAETGGDYIAPQLNSAATAYSLEVGGGSYRDRTIVRKDAISSEHEEISAEISLEQPYIVVYFWRRIA